MKRGFKIINEKKKTIWFKNWVEEKECIEAKLTILASNSLCVPNIDKVSGKSIIAIFMSSFSILR